MNDEQKAHLRLIARAYLEGKLVIFVGAGVSMNSGLPSWRDLAITSNTILPPEIRSNSIMDDDLLTHFEKFEKFRKKPDLIKHVKHELTKNKPQPNYLHELIFDLTNETIVTTNYDTLLEIYSSQNNLKFEIVNEPYKTVGSSKKQCIIKIHGDVDTKSIVITQSDYDRFKERNDLLTSFLIHRTLFHGATILFIGFSGTDPNINSILSKIHLQVEEYSTPFYLLTDSKDSAVDSLQHVKSGVILPLYIVSDSDFQEVNINIAPFESKATDLINERGRETAKTLFYVRETARKLDEEYNVEKISRELEKYSGVVRLNTNNFRTVLDYLNLNHHIQYNSWIINENLMLQVQDLKTQKIQEFIKFLRELYKFQLSEIREQGNKKKINIEQELSQNNAHPQRLIFEYDLLMDMNYVEIKKIVDAKINNINYEETYQISYCLQLLGMYKEAWDFINNYYDSNPSLPYWHKILHEIHIRSISNTVSSNFLVYRAIKDAETLSKMRSRVMEFDILKYLEKNAHELPMHFTQFIIGLFERSCVFKFLTQIMLSKEKLERNFIESLKGSVSFSSPSTIDLLNYEFEKYIGLTYENSIPTFFWWENNAITKEYVTAVCTRMACDNVYKKIQISQQFEDFATPIELETFPYYALIHCVLTSDEIFIEQLEMSYKISDFTVSSGDIENFTTAFNNIVEFTCNYNSDWSLLNMHSKQIVCFLRLFHLLKTNLNKQNWVQVFASISNLIQKCVPKESFTSSLRILLQTIEALNIEEQLVNFTETRSLFYEKFMKANRL